MEQIVNISCSEENNILTDNIIDNAINILVKNPFGEFLEMDFESRNKWQKINLYEIKKKIIRNDGVVQLRNKHIGIKGSFSKHPLSNVITFSIKINIDTELEILKDYFMSICECLPQFKIGTIKCDIPIRLMYEEFDIPNAPVGFGNIGWIILINPTKLIYYTREELLNIPSVYEISELSNGNIFIKFYKHPLDYNKFDNIQQISDITLYLNNIVEHKT